MRLRSPAEFYIKALLADPRRLSDEQVCEELEEDGVNPLSVDYLGRLRKRLKVPDPFIPTRRDHLPSQQFLAKEKLWRFFHPDNLMREARHIFAKPRVREFVESMLLVRVPHTSIANYVTRQHKTKVAPASLEIFAHFFWNIDLLDTTQMRLLQKLRFDGSSDATLKDRKKLLGSAYWDDARVVAGELASTPASALVVQLRMGVLPQKSELASRLGEVQRIAALRAIEALAHGGVGDSQKFLNYMHASKIIEELVQSIAKPEDQLKSQISAVGLKVETRALPSIQSLSGGSHTVEMTPLEESRHDKSRSEP